MGITKREATLDELLSDPLMATVLQHARTTPDDVRAMMRDARERLARAASPTDGYQALSDDQQIYR